MTQKGHNPMVRRDLKENRSLFDKLRGSFAWHLGRSTFGSVLLYICSSCFRLARLLQHQRRTLKFPSVPCMYSEMINAPVCMATISAKLHQFQCVSPWTLTVASHPMSSIHTRWWPGHIDTTSMLSWKMLIVMCVCHALLYLKLCQQQQQRATLSSAACIHSASGV